MKQSFVHHFNVIAPALQPGLAGPGCINAMAELSSLLPFDFAGDFGFESRLGDPVAACDFIFQIRKNSEGAQMLAGKSLIAGLSVNLLADPLWQRITKLFDAWTTPGHLLAGTVDVFWLEFDYNEKSYNLNPNIFFGIGGDKAAGRNTQWESGCRILDEIYQILFNIPFPDDLAENLRVCVYALPEHAGLYQIGFMIPRQKEAIRLVLSNIAAGKLEHYLADIGWTGDYREVRCMIDHYSGHFDYFICNINIGKQILPYFALEMYFKNLSQPRFNPNWDAALDLLQTENLITPEKRLSLLRFCGKTEGNHFYPIKYIKGLNHLKLVYQKNTPFECKGYFGVMIKEADKPS